MGRRVWGCDRSKEEVCLHIVSPWCEDKLIVVLTKEISPAMKSQRLVVCTGGGEHCSQGLMISLDSEGPTIEEYVPSLTCPHRPTLHTRLLSSIVLSPSGP